MKIKHFVLGLLLFCSSFACWGDELPDLATVKQLLIAYHDNGEYYHQVDSVIKEAMYYLQFRLNQNSRLKNQRHLAIVLDIDETALSNYPDMLHLNFGGTLEEINELANFGHDPAIPGVKALYNYASQHKVAVFFVTGRKEYQRQATERNLRTVGYEHWDGLIMKPNEAQRVSASTYKVAIRKQIIKMGYDIVLNIGDQRSDLEGGYADMSFKLPNPYYRIN